MNMKEKWVEEIMQSIDNLQDVEVSDMLHARILQQIPIVQQRFSVLSKTAKWALVACILILIGLNGITILHYNEAQHKNANINVSIENPIYTEYFAHSIQ